MQNEVTVENLETSLISVIPQKAIMTVKRNNYLATINGQDITLIRNQDFGVIRSKDGKAISNKPTLYKSGAEKLLFAYQIPYDIEISDSYKDHKNGYFYYEVKAIAKVNGQIIRVGVGCANTNEKSNGFAQPFDSANNMFKKAKKRAIVDLALSLSGAGDFTQDIENEDFMDNSTLIVGDGKLKDTDYITSKQITRLFAIAGQNGITKEAAKEIIIAKGFVSTKQITQADYDIICKAFEEYEGAKQ